MKLDNSVNEYLEVFKVDDLIAFNGMGSMNKISKLRFKHEVDKVTEGTTKNELRYKNYRGRIELIAKKEFYSQKIAVLDRDEFKKLK